METIEEIKLKIAEAQEELSMHIESGDWTEAFEVEQEIDRLQNQLSRLKQNQTQE